MLKRKFKIKTIALLVTVAFVYLFHFSNPVSASPRESCSDHGISTSSNNFNQTLRFGDPFTLEATVISTSDPGLISGEGYHLSLRRQTGSVALGDSPGEFAPPSRSINFSWSVQQALINRLTPAVYEVGLHNNQAGFYYTGWLGTDGCTLGTITIRSQYECEFLRISKESAAGTQMCYADENSCLESGNGIVNVEAKVLDEGSTYQGRLVFTLNGGANWGNDENVDYDPALGYHKDHFSPNGEGNYRITVSVKGAKNVPICYGNFTQISNCSQCQTDPTNVAIASQATFGEEAAVEPYKICDQIDRNQSYLQDAYNNCIECVGGIETGSEGIWTAIGCIPRDPTAIVQNLLRIGLGIGGGVALLMILAAGLLFSTSQGDPKRTGQAKELLTAAITGLLFIIFSVTILQFIGLTVLKIPGFGT